MLDSTGVAFLTCPCPAHMLDSTGVAFLTCPCPAHMLDSTGVAFLTGSCPTHDSAAVVLLPGPSAMHALDSALTLTVPQTSVCTRILLDLQLAAGTEAITALVVLLKLCTLGALFMEEDCVNAGKEPNL